MASWERQFKEFYSMTRQLAEQREKRDNKLRFNRVFIRASDAADQYFCEKKVEMRYIHGKIETKEKTTGCEAHEKLLEDMPKIELKDLWKKIYEKKPIYASEMLLLARYARAIA